MKAAYVSWQNIFAYAKSIIIASKKYWERLNYYSPKKNKDRDNVEERFLVSIISTFLSWAAY